MAATPEAKAKAKVDKCLKAAGCYYITPTTAGFGKSGAPDRMGVANGRMFGCEVKAGTGLTELQKDHLRRIEAAGGFSFVVRIQDNRAYGLGKFCSFLGVSIHEAGKQIKELGPLAEDDFRTHA
jgi:hypothetical protein